MTVKMRQEKSMTKQYKKSKTAKSSTGKKKLQKCDGEKSMTGKKV